MSSRLFPLFLVFTGLLLSMPMPLKAQQQNNTPRYNRFQYHKYHWMMRRSTEGMVYYPTGSDSIGSYVAAHLPAAIKEIKKTMMSDMAHKPSVIIYPSADQQYESNIGSAEPGTLTLPTFLSKGDRIVITYNGSYKHLKEQLYEGIARAIWQSQLDQDLAAQAQGTATNQTTATNQNKNGSPTKPVSGNTQSKSQPIPQWYQEGAIRYFAHQWPITAEDVLRNSMQVQHFNSYQELLSYEPRLGGQAFCYFLTEKYLPNANAQIYQQLKKKHDLKRVIRLVTKHNLDTLYSQCFAYYNQRFGLNASTESNDQPQATLTIPHKKGIVLNTIVSPAKTQIAYVLATTNKRTVYVYDIPSKQVHKIAEYPVAPWIDDHSNDIYPIVAWGSDSRTLFAAMPIKGKVTITRYTPEGTSQEKDVLYGVDGINSLQPLHNNQYLLTAYRGGQSDIVKYDERKERYTTYTDDYFDDQSPVYAAVGNRAATGDHATTDANAPLYFISNRPLKQGPLIWLIGVGFKKDTLWQGIYTIKDQKVVPLTADTDQLNQWHQLTALSNGQLLGTNTKYGAENYVQLSPEGKEELLGHYQPMQYLANTDEVVSYNTTKDSIHIDIQPYNRWKESQQQHPADTSSPWLTDYLARQLKQKKEDSILHAARDTSHSFLDQVMAAQNANTHKKGNNNKTNNAKTKKTKEPPEVTPYVLQLHSAYFTAQVNNDYFMNRYQPYQAYQGQFKFPEIGGMAQGGFTDLFEDHHFTIAYRIPSSTEGSSFYINYDNTKRTTDWGLTYYRDVSTLQPDPNRNWVDENGNPYPNNAKVYTHYYEFYAKKPLNYDLSLGFTTGVRQDKTVFWATDRRSLDFPDYQSTWSITTLSATWNKLQPTIPFLYKGFYAKALTDVFKGFSQDEAVLFGSTVDVAYHQPLYKYITLVVQLQAGYSGGDQKVLYNLGGVDNNVTPRVDSNVHFSQTAPYAFQTLVTPFRGYFQNSLYGNEYKLANADLYFPVFKTLIPLQTPLPSINNLQLGVFSDAATATETWEANPNNNRWLLSYGLSARTTLAGYPLRIDVAWPAGTNRPPVCYFSLNLM